MTSSYQKFKESLTRTIEEVDSEYNLRPFIDAPLKSSYHDQLNPLILDTVDLSLFIEGPEGLPSRVKLAKRLEESITTYGFFNLINWGAHEEQIERIRSIAQSLLTISELEKKKFQAGNAQVSTNEEYDDEDQAKIGAERGFGFKPKGYWSIKNGVRDEIDLFNIRDIGDDEAFYSKSYPEILKYHLEEVNDYYKHLHFDVTQKLLRLCDIILEIPEFTLWNTYFVKDGKGTEDSKHAGHGRFMLYQPYNQKNEKEAKKAWLKPHTDISAFSFITSQPILSLQINDFYTGKWKYVSHRPNSLVVNIGDALEFISNGYFKACLHRVQTPPPDQKELSRLVLIYFQNPADHAILDGNHLGSDKLRRLGLINRIGWDRITFAQWDTEKGKRLAKNGFDEREDSILYGREIERWHHKDLT